MADAGSASDSGGGAGPASQEVAIFQCNICFETATSPVVTQCGHLFCWPCIHQWLQSGHAQCPVCKAGATRDNVIPIYGRGATEQRDPRSESIPERPRGHRPEVPQPAPANGQGLQFQGGFMFFPTLFGFQFNSGFGGGGGGAGNAAQTPEQAQAAFISQLLFGLGMLILSAIVLGPG